MQIEIHNIDYTPFISLLGTAHFTKRSIREADEAVRNSGTRDLAIELDKRRFDFLNRVCFNCPKKDFCSTKCEFIGASEALGNVDANIWLIDMSIKEMRRRIYALGSPRSQRLQFLNRIMDADLPWLWEQGFKDEVIQRSNKRLDALRNVAPQLWKVLIEERNALMAVRLASIASSILEMGERPNILVIVGATHVKGIEELLKMPMLIQEELRRLNLPYSPPAMIKRVQVKNIGQI